MNISNSFSLATLKIRSMFSTALFSVTLSPTNGHARPYFAGDFILWIDENDRCVGYINPHYFALYACIYGAFVL